MKQNMNHTKMHYVSVILLVMLLSTLNSCKPENSKSNSKIDLKASPMYIGLWQLQKIEQVDTASSKKWVEADWMKGGKGLLSYNPNGTMSVHFTPAGYGEDSTLSEQDYWYVARYEEVKGQNALKHTRIMHSDPKQVGQTVTRYYSIQGDTLIMNAKDYDFKLTWTRF